MEGVDHCRRFWPYPALLVITVLLAIFSVHSTAQLPASAEFHPNEPKAGSPGTPLSPGSAELIYPEELLKTLDSVKPTILYVGPRLFYAQAHIRGAEFIGPAGNPQSLETLRKRIAALPKASPVVLYCGCCPWDHCPNIRPAYRELRSAGFSRVKVLFLPTSFGHDWVDKGYPVEKGS